MTDQSKISRLHHPVSGVAPVGRADLLGRISNLNDMQLGIVGQFVQQILLCHDPDVVTSFVNWRHDPKIGSILSIAADLDEDFREQLLFVAEEMFRQHTEDTDVSRFGAA